ncbi:MAG TPA: FliA/WhiG family RNA polymerase sigma factor [Bryobacteraceae bacterium]|nr:FliA/WhiG family RNA polymerase sigma factor [Bryobacteraceae bacterium]
MRAQIKIKAQVRAVKKSETPISTAQDRERLILEHLPQVRLIARRIHGRLPESVNLDDLVSTGTLGLIAAIDHFDPRHNVKLKTYAEYKIRGAILDSLRGLDWAPRQQRKRSRQIEAAIAAIEQRLQRAPSEEEIAKELELTLEQYHNWLLDIRGVNIGSLETISPNGDRHSLLKYISDDEETWPSRMVERSELRRLLAEAIQRIPPTERTVISLLYHQELTLREISKIVELHESRVSQLKYQAILRLRSYLENRWPKERGASRAGWPRLERLSGRTRDQPVLQARPSQRKAGPASSQELESRREGPDAHLLDAPELPAVPAVASSQRA